MSLPVSPPKPSFSWQSAMKLWLVLVILFFFAHVRRSIAKPSWALGSSLAGRQGATYEQDQDPFVVDINPSWLATLKRGVFNVSTTFGSSQWKVKPRSLSSLKFPKFNISRWTLALATPIFNNNPLTESRLGVGILASGNFRDVHKMNLHTNGANDSLRYGNTSSDLYLAIGAGITAIKNKWFLGGGASFYLSAAGNAGARILGSTTEGDLAINIRLNTVPHFGTVIVHNNHRFSLTYRHARDVTIEQKLLGKFELINGAPPLEVPILLGANYYEPHSFQVGWSHHWSRVSVFLKSQYELWRRYKFPSLQVTALLPGRKPVLNRLTLPRLKNTLGFTAATSVRNFFKIRNIEANLSYSYQPSPVSSLTNIDPWDATTHLFGFSIEKKLSDVVSIPVTLSTFFQYHLFESRNSFLNKFSTVAPVGGSAKFMGFSLRTSFD